MDITEDIQQLVTISLREDLDNIGDITTQSTIDKNKSITASMVARENGVIAGTEIAAYVFSQIDPTVQVKIHIKDGEKITSKQKIITVSGNAQNILQAERTALNFLTHLSGIATETARYVQTVSHTDTKILDTRKTLPGWRILQKHAVEMGGGQNHRMGLYDMVLIKDNHIAAAKGVTQALDRIKASDNLIKATNPDVKIEIEVDTLGQLQEVIDHGTADIVLLDNMRGNDLTKAISMCKGKIKTEASGGIDLTTIKDIAESGVDYISIGALTHSVKVFDIGLDIE